MTTRSDSTRPDTDSSGSRTQSQSQSPSQSPDAYIDDEMDLFLLMAVIATAAVLLPWLYALLERVNVEEVQFEGLHRSRALWLLPLFYGASALGTVLLFPAHLELFWAFHVLVLAQVGESVLHALGYVTGLSLPLVAQFTLWRVGGALLVLAGTVRASLWLRTWDTARECRRQVGVGNYVLPFRGAAQSSDHMDLTRFVGLQKDRSLLVLGETGAGKTETMQLFTHQMQASRDEPFVVFDYKGEYREQFTEAQGEENVIRLSSQGATASWNLFCEIKYERDIEEIGRALFPQTDDGEFFGQAARQLFVAVVTYLHREGLQAKTVPTNADLVAFVEQTDKQELYERLSEYPDLVAAAAAIDPDADRQAAGVYANFQQVIADLFRGDFADDGEFSIREYMENPEGRTLMLDFPVTEGDAVQPAFRFFIDWAARFALTDDRNTYFVLDEFARLPELRKIGDLINTGRSRNTQLLLGVQSVAQLNDTYGRDRASALLSGLVQSVVLRVGDKASIDYARSQIGREQQHRSVPVRGRSGRSVGRQELTSETYSIAESTLARLGDGEAIVITANGWIRGQIMRFKQVRGALDRALDRVEES